MMYSGSEVLIELFHGVVVGEHEVGQIVAVSSVERPMRNEVLWRGCGLSLLLLARSLVLFGASFGGTVRSSQQLMNQTRQACSGSSGLPASEERRTSNASQEFNLFTHLLIGSAKTTDPSGL